MNSLEKLIYNWVKKNPRIKNSLRDVYQLLMYSAPVKQKVVNDSMIVRPGFYFGFHDKSPWSYNDKYLLANKFPIQNRRINKSDSIEIGIFEGERFEKFIPLASTSTFNWQQGCMLQWVGKKDVIAYNGFEGEKHIGIIIDINGYVIKKLSLPIAAISPDGKYALSYSFSRLTKYASGYGYENGSDDEEDIQIPQKQGIWIIDIETGNEKKLFSVSDIVSMEPDKSMDNSFHYFTHCLFSPSGKRFVFYHRWIKDMNIVRTRMLSCDLDGQNKFVFPTNGMVSHIGWKDDKSIMAYCSTEKYGDSYVLFEDKSNVYNKVGMAHFTSDGHPSFSPHDNRWFITDTYPDRFRLSTLILYDSLKNKRYDLAKLKQPLGFKDELRCDLHPRWNRSGTVICFDSAHTGTRSLCTLNIEDELRRYN